LKHTVRTIYILLIYYTKKNSLVFGLKAGHNANDRGWRRSASSTLLNHLADCLYQTDQIRSRALNDPASSKSLRSLSASGPAESTSSLRMMDQARVGGGHVPHITYPPQQPIPGASTGPGTLDHWHQSLPFHSINPTPSPLPSPLIFSSGLSESLAPSDSISQTNSQHGSGPSASADSQGSVGLHDRILRRSLSRRGTQALNINNQYTTWSTEKQQSFENRLGRLTASAGLPFSWVDNPEWLAFVDEFIPAAQSPGRRKLTRTIVPKLVKEIRNQAKKEVHGQNVTIQADGWTGENHHHLIAFMITVRAKVSSRLEFNYI
jgi:hypothetical protein